MSITKIIFLDVDGVLNSETFWEEKAKDNPDSDWDSFSLDPKAINVLNAIIEKTNAKVVISSSWRIGYYEFLITLLKDLGFKGEVIDKTSSNSCYSCLRGNLILDWIKENEDIINVPYYQYKNYLIIDDSTDMLYWQKDNFLITDPMVGLQEDQIDKAVNTLNQA